VRLWLPRLRWRVLDPKEAADLGMEQAGRVRWRAFEFAWLRFGFVLFAEVMEGS